MPNPFRLLAALLAERRARRRFERSYARVAELALVYMPELDDSTVDAVADYHASREASL